MKALIRKTNEVVDVISYSSNTIRNDVLDSVSYIDSEGNEHIEKGLNYYWDFLPIGDIRDKESNIKKENLGKPLCLSDIILLLDEDIKFKIFLRQNLRIIYPGLLEDDINREDFEISYKIISSKQPSISEERKKDRLESLFTRLGLNNVETNFIKSITISGEIIFNSKYYKINYFNKNNNEEKERYNDYIGRLSERERNRRDLIEKRILENLVTIDQDEIIETIKLISESYYGYIS